MAKEKMKSLKAEYSALSKLFSFILKKPVRVKNVECNELGYTYIAKKVAEIYVAFEHELYEELKLNAIQKRFFRKGVGAHELLHQLLTNFSYTSMRIDARPPEERQLLQTFLNIGEDPAIEYFAPTQFGGDLLKALRFTIAKIYKASPNIDDAECAYSQLISALIQFGDMGFVKGKFTYPEAEEAYKRILPDFYKGITEPNGRKRVDIFEGIFNSLNSLWQEVADNEKAMQELMDMLREMGMTNSSGSGRGNTPDSEPSSDKNKERRKKVLEELLEELSKSGGSGSGGVSGTESDDESDGTGAGKPKKSEEDSDKENSSGSSNSDDEKDKSDSSDNGDDAFEGAEDDGEGNFTKKSNGSENSSASSDSSDGDRTDAPNTEYNLPGSGELESSDICFEDYELTDEDIAKIEVEIKQELHDEDVLNVEYIGDTTPLLEATGIAEIGKCLNVRIKPNTSEEAREKYNIIVNNYSAEIKRTVKVLKDIFALDRAKEQFGHSGKVKPKNVNRINGVYTRNGLVTENLFNRRVNPKDISDVAIAIAVDESGSMGCRLTNAKSRSECARETCIALAEIFSELNIPTYIMGFTADERGYDTVHHHYVTWKNNKADRLALLNIDNCSDNRDGASIRYLTKILKQKQAKRKILFVISDGQPAANNYYNGVADTSLALREARKNAEVIGVVLGNNTDEVLVDFYQKNYAQVKSNESIFVAMTKILKKVIK